MADQPILRLKNGEKASRAPDIFLFVLSNKKALLKFGAQKKITNIKRSKHDLLVVIN